MQFIVLLLHLSMLQLVESLHNLPINTFGANYLSLKVVTQIVIAAYYYFTYLLSVDLVNLLLFVLFGHCNIQTVSKQTKCKQNKCNFHLSCT